jgi:hypothetical protein
LPRRAGHESLVTFADVSRPSPPRRDREGEMISYGTPGNMTQEYGAHPT